MEIQTISQVSKKYGISIRTLRYYEQIGLIKSIRNDDNAYRFYDESTVKQIHFVILLRKLRISVRQIKEILDNQNALATVEIFERNIGELDEEITSLSTIKSILAQFTEELRAKANMVLQHDLLNDANMVSIIDSISFSKNYINNIKENLSMEDLNKASETLSKLEEKKISETIGPVETIKSTIDNNQKKLEKFEIEKNEPYKFVGKSVYLGNKRGSSELFASIWEKSTWVFDELDKMKEYATSEIHNAVLFTWEKYDDKSELFGYYVGRFMKSDTPVTKDIDFDYFDISEGYIAKAWTKGKFGDKFGNMLVYGEQCTNDEIAKAGYKAQGWIWMAEIYPKPDENGDSFVATYMKCEK